MIVHQFHIDRARLDAAPENERALFLTLAHFSNQATILGKWVLWAGPVDAISDLEKKGRAAQVMMVVTILAAKLNEAWGLLGRQFFGSSMSKEYVPKLDEDAQAALKELGRYFGKANVIRTCRDGHAFHYDSDVVKEHYKTLPADEETDFYLCAEFSGCNLFHVAEMAVGHALLSKLGNGNSQAGMDLLVADTLKVSVWFQDFVAGFATVFLERVGVPKAIAIELAGLPSFESLAIPFLSKRPAE